LDLDPRTQKWLCNLKKALLIRIRITWGKLDQDSDPHQRDRLDPERNAADTI
jgi:hypothetical protein